MQISLIAAIDKKNAISKEGKIPWHIPCDLIHFRNITLKKPIIMGRRTFESIGKVLPERRNIIISHDSNLKISGAEVFTSINDVLFALSSLPEIVVIGGESIYKKFLPYASKIYLTVIDHDFFGDKYFPTLNLKKWQKIEHVKINKSDTNPYDLSFITLIRVCPQSAASS